MTLGLDTARAMRTSAEGLCDIDLRTNWPEIATLLTGATSLAEADRDVEEVAAAQTALAEAAFYRRDVSIASAAVADAREALDGLPPSPWREDLACRLLCLQAERAIRTDRAGAMTALLAARERAPDAFRRTAVDLRLVYVKGRHASVEDVRSLLDQAAGFSDLPSPLDPRPWPSLEGELLFGAAVVANRTGRSHVALRFIDRALKQARAMGSMEVEAETLVLRAAASAAAEGRAEADDAFDAALRMCTTLGYYDLIEDLARIRSRA